MYIFVWNVNNLQRLHLHMHLKLWFKAENGLKVGYVVYLSCRQWYDWLDYCRIEWNAFQ